MKKYIRKEISEIVDIPDRRVEFYTNQGIFPKMEEKVGRGVSRQYSQQNIFELFIAKRLCQNGISLLKIKEILKKLRTYMLYKRLFTNSGDINIKKTLAFTKGQIKPFLIVYDLGVTVVLVWEGTKSFQKSKGSLSFFSMQGHDSALVLDLAIEILRINNL